VASIERMLSGLAFGYRARKTVLDRSDRHIAQVLAALVIFTALLVVRYLWSRGRQGPEPVEEHGTGADPDA